MANVDEKTKQLMDIRTLMLASITSALAFVVGLFWNDAIKSAIEQFVPPGEGVAAKFISAIIVTVIVVAAVYLMFRAMHIAEKQIEEVNELPRRIRRRAKGSA